MLRQHCHDIGLATYVVTLDGELFQLVTLILTWLYLGLEPGLGFDSSGLRLDSSGLGLGLGCQGLGLACQRLGLGTCWTRYRSVFTNYYCEYEQFRRLHLNGEKVYVVQNLTTFTDVSVVCCRALRSVSSISLLSEI